METRGKVIRMKWITREYVQSNPDTVFVFGDNMVRKGYGGQDAAMRGEPNVIGVPTKWSPSQSEEAFFSEKDFRNTDVLLAIAKAFSDMRKALREGRDVVIPADGLGTGLS